MGTVTGTLKPPLLAHMIARARASHMRPDRIIGRVRDRRTWKRMAGPKLIAAFAVAYPDAFFIEIGANDGKQHDHLDVKNRAPGWRGIMVEPVPHVFERLRRNYGELDGIALENAAIADRDGTMPFYHPSEVSLGGDRRGLPDWYDGLGSFSLEVLLKHEDRIPDIRERVVETDVPCMTFATLCRKHSVERVDLLMVDTEGYDYEVIKGIDFAVNRPRLIIYEHYHLAPDEQAACMSLLQNTGYETMAEGLDTFAMLTDDDDALTRTWRSVHPAVPAASSYFVRR